jgi:hypothetical protein
MPEQIAMMKELRQLTENLQSRRLLHGFWDAYSSCTGNIPDAREGACMAILNGNLYVFGGFSHSLLNDVKVFNFAEKNWRNIKPRDD